MKKQPKPYYPKNCNYACVKVKVDGKFKRLYYHRYLWELHYGKIPQGYQIHHKDGNKINNDLDNLECMSEHAHCSIPKGPEPNRKGWITRRARSAAKLSETNKSSLEGSTTNR